MSELKPCPFCGAKEGDHSPPKIFDYEHEYTTGRYRVFCWGCQAESHLCVAETDAIAAWNRRASDNDPRFSCCGGVDAHDITCRNAPR